MAEGPDIALIGSLIGDPARANMLAALMDGRALTASELAGEASVSLPTASGHLKRLAEGGLVVPRRQGRHRYFALADADVGRVLEAVMGLAARHGHLRSRPGPRDPVLRRARVCYDHLAGEIGVEIFDRLADRGWISVTGETVALTGSGRDFAAGFGIDLDGLSRGRRPLCRSCLDWSARRSHLAGAFGAALWQRIEAEGWARRVEGTRAVQFTSHGEAALRAALAG